MQKEYACLFKAYREETAEAFLYEVSNQLSSPQLGLSASDGEIIASTRKLAKQFSTLSVTVMDTVSVTVPVTGAHTQPIPVTVFSTGKSLAVTGSVPITRGLYL